MINLMPNIDLIQIIPIALSFLLLALYLREYFYNREIKKTSKTALHNQDESFEVLHNAIKKAENIIAIAELQGLKIAASDKLQSKKFENQYSESIKNTAEEINQALIQARQEFEVYLEGLSRQTDQSAQNSQQIVRDRINSFFEKFEANLSTFLTETQQQSTKAIEMEIQAARQLIQTYKTQQFTLIDENIVAMLERTLSLVLVKKLSLKDQTDLIYESLEKAKAEKFIA